MTLGDLARLSVVVGVVLLLAFAWWGFRRRRHRHEWSPWRIVRTPIPSGRVPFDFSIYGRPMKRPDFPGQKDIWGMRSCACGATEREWIDRTVRC